MPIRPVVEYIIICDNGSVCVDGFGNSTAFGSPTRTDCESSATEHGWKQISKRKWICPDCFQRDNRASSATVDEVQI